MKILVIGAGGQVGGLLMAGLRGHEVRGTRRPEVDLRDRLSVKAAIEGFEPEAVVLAAGLADADYCEDHPGETYAVNMDGTRNVAMASKGRHFTYFSTDHVFDGRAGPYSEEDRPNPLSTYGRTKVEAERIVFAVHPRSLVVRTSLVFQHQPGGRNFFMKLLEAREPVPCWSDHVGTYTYGPNLADAVAELVSTGRTGLWNVAGTSVLDRHEFAMKVARRFRLNPALYYPVPIAKAPPRAPRPLRAGLKTDKARAALRTKLLSVDEALELAYRAYGRP
jgi:dTDP-4-dehydrorhamnose reductase